MECCAHPTTASALSTQQKVSKRVCRSHCQPQKTDPPTYRRRRQTHLRALLTSPRGRLPNRALCLRRMNVAAMSSRNRHRLAYDVQRHPSAVSAHASIKHSWAKHAVQQSTCKRSNAAPRSATEGTWWGLSESSTSSRPQGTKGSLLRLTVWVPLDQAVLVLSVVLVGEI